MIYHVAGRRFGDPRSLLNQLTQVYEGVTILVVPCGNRLTHGSPHPIHLEHSHHLHRSAVESKPAILGELVEATTGSDENIHLCS